MKKQLSLIVVTLLLFTSSHAQQVKLDSLFEGFSEEPGIAVAVYKDGQYVYKKMFGLSNLDYGIEITDKTRFEVGGLTMHITASCILMLEDQGKLTLDDKVSDILEDLPKYQEGEVTINHLLHHTSGIMDYLVALGMTGHVWEMPFSTEDAYELIKKNPKLGFKPGNEYEYSNSNYVLLNKIIQELSDTTINAYATKFLFEPLGMSNTAYYELGNVVLPNRATSYSKIADEYVVNQNRYFTSSGDGRLYTSIDDLMTWANALEEKTHPVKDAESRLEARGVLNDGSEIGYALGVEHGIEKGYSFYGHTGYWDGFSAMFLKVPQANFWVLTLSNNESISAPNHAYKILDLLIDQNPNTVEPKAYAMSVKNLRKYEGDYIAYKNGYLKELVVENDTLVYKYTEDSGRAYKLMPIGKDRFKLLGTLSDYTLQFALEKGKPIKMNLIREGIINYRYESYVPSKTPDINSFLGRYRNEALEVTYELKQDEKEGIAIFVKGEKLMNYVPVMANIFCSESTHHGYLRFNETKSEFTISDYSFKPMRFERVE
ncbi:MAG: serine hydrolase domain-containing protein [Ekhidna sp.]